MALKMLLEPRCSLCNKFYIISEYQNQCVYD
nr:MAG TPA: hypothetical protein [Caudoviricetes sp.]